MRSQFRDFLAGARLVALAGLSACGGCCGGGSANKGGGGAGPLTLPVLTPMIINYCARKAYGDLPFTQAPPTSNSPGHIRYSSCNAFVATIDAVTGQVTLLSPEWPSSMPCRLPLPASHRAAPPPASP